MNFKGKESGLSFCYGPVSFVLFSLNFVPNIEMNLIYYDVLKLN